jgi:hypothetical protein
MIFGRMLSLVTAIAAVLGLFVEIPIVSDYAFWVLVGALLVWWTVHRLDPKNHFRGWVNADHRAASSCDRRGFRRDPNSNCLRVLGFWPPPISSQWVIPVFLIEGRSGSKDHHPKTNSDEHRDTTPRLPSGPTANAQ